ncbi:MAG: helix-turn-helix transcriptional regulator [Eubacterium aggregans]|uniref:helix-turn-helix domain-containing protein n=1 Tax=Eubacterium aggregans TaxID=81409 RepID=UPI002B20A217|nr:helix-turn-helix transcriptional regulator [Eubacterium aggregans]MEA5073415.1 helix-turn-helix transcriptional regulator [Eubacterium aggregans]
MKKRIREIRKFAKLTQTEFGELIGVKGNTITGYETGRRTPTDAIILSICREFRINEEWLRTGNGSMFATFSEAEELSALCGKLCSGKDPLVSKLILYYARLPDEDKEYLNKLFQDCINKLAE